MVNYGIMNLGLCYKREMFDMGDKSPKNKEKKKKKAEKKAAPQVLANKSE
jgi:hypothetical protein